MGKGSWCVTYLRIKPFNGERSIEYWSKMCCPVESAMMCKEVGVHLCAGVEACLWGGLQESGQALGQVVMLPSQLLGLQLHQGSLQTEDG